MTKVLSIILGVLLSIWCNTPYALASEATVRIVAGTFPPFRYLDENKVKRGIDYEITKAAFKIMGRDLSFEFLPFLRALNEVKSGDAHGIAALTINEERRTFMRFSDPISLVRDVIFAHKGLLPNGWGHFEDLRSCRLGKAKGYNYHASFQNFPFPFMKEVVHGEDGPEIALIKMVASKRLDAVICEASVCNYILSKHPQLRAYVERQSREIGPVRPFHLGFSKAHPETEALLKEFNAALDVLREKGTLARIYERYGLKM